MQKHYVLKIFLVSIFCCISFTQDVVKAMKTDVSDLFPQLKSETNIPNEIEIKIKLDDEKRSLLKKWLYESDQVQKKGTTHMKDIYFNNPQDPFLFDQTDDNGKTFKDILRSVRVRFCDKGTFITTKLRNLDEHGKTLNVEEFEFPISEKEAEKTISEWHAKGYTQEFIVEKKREKFLYNGLEIVIDDVDGLDGIFVEIELKCEVPTVQAGKEMIYDFLKARGITEFTQFDRSYLHIMINPDYDFGDPKVL